MKKLYRKSELAFSIVWIVIYCVLQSVANPLSQAVGVGYSVHAVINILLTIALLYFIKTSKLSTKYGLCKSVLSARKLLWYLPLIVLASNNLWNGIEMRLPWVDTICYLCTMLCVGFLEEIIFRGFLFVAMKKDNVRAAIIVSSITFGIGHFLNLINGSGMDFTANLCQVLSAIAIGFLFVTIFYHSKSLIPCIATHSAINMLSAFANEISLTMEKRIIFSLIIIVVAVAYTLFLTRTSSRNHTAT